MTQHWGNYLTRGFTYGQTSTVTLDIDPEHDHPALVTVASRIRGLYDALAAQPGPDERDPLAAEDLTELGRLLDHLHRVTLALTGQEDRLLVLLAERGMSTREIARYLDTNHNNVRRRLERIARAEAVGLNSGGLADAEPAED